jgi:hypothetical protein
MHESDAKSELTRLMKEIDVFHLTQCIFIIKPISQCR